MADLQEISEDHLRISLKIAIRRVKFTPERHRRVGETDCVEIAKAILDSFKLSGWKVMHEPAPPYSVNYSKPRG